MIVLALGVVIYIRITPFDDIELIRNGNIAVAISFGGAIIGLSVPLAFTLASSVTVWEVLIWGLLTVLIQLAAYRATDRLLKDLPERISAGNIGASVTLVSFKLAFAFLNAAAIIG